MQISRKNEQYPKFLSLIAHEKNFLKLSKAVINSTSNQQFELIHLIKVFRIYNN